jgi:RHS repeat-associated protein
VDYSYAKVGNFFKKTDYSVNSSSAYSYGGSTCLNKPNAVCQLDKLNGTTVYFQYDNRGNLRVGDGLTMTYNAMDKPLTIIGIGAETGFIYGSDGMRAKQTRSVSGVNTSTYYVDKYYEVDSDGSWRAYLDDIAVLSYTPARQHLLHFTLRDRLGSGTTMADQNGVVISRRYFDPFGKTTTQSPSASLLENIRRMTYDLDIAKMQDLDVTNKNRRGFTDHEHLNEQQLIHMNGRVYDYNLGRFMSVDPLIQAPTSTQSVNPYSYIMNNPLAGTDPTGYEGEVAETVEVAEKTVLVSSIGSNLRSRVTATVASDGKGGHSVTASGGNGAAREGVINAIAGKLSGAGFQVSNVGSPGDNAAKGSTIGENPNADRQVSSKQIELTKFNEGYKDKLYDDDGDLDGNTTIGYGTLVHKGPIDGRDSEKPFKNGITEDRAEELLIERLRTAESDVRSLVNVPLKQNQFDALVDLAYQVGRGQLSGTQLIKHINSGAMNKASNEFNFRRSNGKIIPGLQNRSNRRYNTFRNGDYREWQDAKRYQVTISDL